MSNVWWTLIGEPWSSTKSNVIDTLTITLSEYLILTQNVLLRICYQSVTNFEQYARGGWCAGSYIPIGAKHHQINGSYSNIYETIYGRRGWKLLWVYLIDFCTQTKTVKCIESAVIWNPLKHSQMHVRHEYFHNINYLMHCVYVYKRKKT